MPGNKVKLTIDVNEGKRARIRQINIAGNTAYHRRRAARRVRAEHAELVVLVQAGRSLLARIAVGRPGKAALVLHGSRLRELPRDLDAGGDRAGEGRHLRHRQRRRRRGVQDLRDQDGRQHGRAGVGAAPPDFPQARRHVFAAADHRDSRGDEAAPRHRRLCVRDRRSGADAEQRHQGNLADLRGRSEEPRVSCAG